MSSAIKSLAPTSTLSMTGASGNRALRKPSTVCSSTSWALSVARYFKLAATSPGMATMPGWKKSSDSGKSPPSMLVTGLPLLSRNWTSSSSRVCSRKAAEANSTSIVGIDVRVVAVVGRQCVVAHQGRQPFVVGDRLNLADDDLPCTFIQLLVGPSRMFLGQQRCLVIVLADEQRGEIRQLDVLVGTHVAGREQRIFGHARCCRPCPVPSCCRGASRRRWF